MNAQPMRATIAPLRSVALLLALAATPVAFAGCGDDDDAGDTTPATTATVTATVTATATSGGETPEPTATSTPSATATPTEAPTPTPEPVDSTAAVAAARAALGSWLGPVGDPASIVTGTVEQVDWPNGCLGIGRPGRVCTQAIVPGFRIELQLANATYEIRTDRTGGTVVWAPATTIMAKFQGTSPNFVHLTTDDGNELNVQTVPGSDFGVDPQTLSPGDAVGLGLAPAPQSGGQLLVSFDPISQ